MTPRLLIQAKVQDHFLKLLESRNEVLRKWTCQLVGHVNFYVATSSIILGIKPCIQLVSLLHDGYPEVVQEVVVEAEAQDWFNQYHLLNLLESSNVVVQKSEVVQEAIDAAARPAFWAKGAQAVKKSSL
ncbi:hypothetical protein B0H19DRAFT_1072509 [Mycena capillaripes]|nr:hypothetical protein B0H19DRAFT_1072509 [Mycena capillaripes]